MGYRPCLLIPCFNHGATMPALLSALEAHDLACIVVDDGSQRETAEILDTLDRRYDWVKVLRHRHNLGKGAAVMNGMREAWRQGFSHALQIDADRQHDLGDLPRLLALSEQEPAALVSGRPVFDDTAPRLRTCGRYLTHAWVWIETLSLGIKDSMCGFRAYPLQSCIPLIDQGKLGRRMDFDPEIMVRLCWRGVPILFFDTRVVYPAAGISHFKPIRDNLLISWMHTRLFFGMLVRLPAWLVHGKTDQQHWSTERERGALAGLKIMLWAYKIAGRGFFSLLLYPVMGYFWVTGSKARRASQDYLRRLRAYAGQKSFPLPERLNSFRHFINFGHAILDKAAAWNGDIKLADVAFPDVELYRQTVRSGQGILIIGAHLGNLESCRALGEQTGDVKINAIVHTRHAERFNRVMASINPRTSMNLIQVSDMGPATAIMLKQKIEQGEWVVIVGDRTPADSLKSVVRAEFLGARAAFPQGPFVLASLLKCPVFLMFGLRERSGVTIHFEQFAERLVLPRGAREAGIATFAQAYADRLAYYCLRAPLDWFNFFDFWKEPA